MLLPTVGAPVVRADAYRLSVGSFKSGALEQVGGVKADIWRMGLQTLKST